MSALVDVNSLTVEQMTALVAQLEVKKQEAEARQRAEEDAKRKEEEARRKAAEKKRAEAEERKRVEGDKKKTGAENSVRCAACIKANVECISSAASSRATACDRCRAARSACTLSDKAEKPKRRKRADAEEDEADEMGLVVAALEVLADKIGQVSEELALNRKVQQKMVTVLDNIFRAVESQKEEVDQLARHKIASRRLSSRTRSLASVRAFPVLQQNCDQTPSSEQLAQAESYDTPLDFEIL